MASHPSGPYRDLCEQAVLMQLGGRQARASTREMDACMERVRTEHPMNLDEWKNYLKKQREALDGSSIEELNAFINERMSAVGNKIKEDRSVFRLMTAADFKTRSIELEKSLSCVFGKHQYDHRTETQKDVVLTFHAMGLLKQRQHEAERASSEAPAEPQPQQKQAGMHNTGKEPLLGGKNMWPSDPVLTHRPFPIRCPQQIGASRKHEHWDFLRATPLRETSQQHGRAV
eukprot:352374-Chlamydomonas_euryale.AAC.10